MTTLGKTAAAIVIACWLVGLVVGRPLEGAAAGLVLVGVLVWAPGG